MDGVPVPFHFRHGQIAWRDASLRFSVRQWIGGADRGNCVLGNFQHRKPGWQAIEAAGRGGGTNVEGMAFIGRARPAGVRRSWALG